MELLTPGSLTLPLLVGLGLLAGFALEALLLARGARWYYAVSLPIGRTPVPYEAPARPAERGAHGGLRFRRIGPGLIAFRADRRDRRLPSLLHGLAVERVVGAKTVLDVRWAPPFTPIVGASWLIVLGLIRGEGQITVPIGLMMIAALALLYHRGAVQACRTLGSALQQEGARANAG